MACVWCGVFRGVCVDDSVAQAGSGCVVIAKRSSTRLQAKRDETLASQ